MITDMGATAAVQAKHVDDLRDDREALRSEIRNLAEYVQASLHKFVGGTKPVSELAINWAGPEDDPIQGTIYALTVAAKFDTDDLPSDCEAYRVYVTERNQPR